MTQLKDISEMIRDVQKYTDSVNIGRVMDVLRFLSNACSYSDDHCTLVSPVGQTCKCPFLDENQNCMLDSAPLDWNLKGVKNALDGMYQKEYGVRP